MECFSLNLKVREHGYDLHKWSVKYLFSIGTIIVFLLHKSSETTIKDSNAIFYVSVKRLLLNKPQKIRSKMPILI